MEKQYFFHNLKKHFTGMREFSLNIMHTDSQKLNKNYDSITEIIEIIEITKS